MNPPIVIIQRSNTPACRIGGLIAVIGLIFSAGCGEEAAPTRASLERILPDKAMRGQVVSLWGKELGTRGSLGIKGKPVTEVKAWSATRVEFVVPIDAPYGQGAITVHPEGGGALEIPFTVEEAPPELLVVEPERAKVGDWVTLRGKGLGERKPDSKLSFYGTDVTEIKSWADDKIEFRIPVPGKVTGITAHLGSRPSTMLTMTLIRPVATGLAPAEALPGEEITLTGTDFTTTRGTVRFETQEVGEKDILEWTDAKIRVRVPEIKEGLVKVRVSSENGISLPVELLVLMRDQSGSLAKSVTDSKFARILMDERDMPHVVFFEQTMQSPVYWYWIGKKPGWLRRHVRIPRDGKQKFVPAIGWFPSVAWDPKGNLHLTCYDLYKENFLYGHHDREKDEWKFHSPDPESKAVGMFTSLAVKPDGEVLIAYMSWNDGMLKLARGKEDKFEISVIDGKPNIKVGMTPSMQLDRKGDPRIAYLDFQSKDLKYAAWDPATKAFALETVDAEGHVGEFAALRLGKDDVPHVVYFQRSTSASEKDGIKLAVRGKDGWKTQVIEEGMGVGFSPGLALDADGRVHTVYMSRDDSALHYAVGQPGKDFKIGVHKVERLWVPEEPMNCDMALGSDGKARAVFWTDPPKTLEIKKLDPPK